MACQICPWVTQELADEYDKCHTFIRVHGEEDPDHVVKALMQIRSLPPKRLKWVEENLEQSAVSFQLLLKAIIEKSEEKESLKAA